MYNLYYLELNDFKQNKTVSSTQYEIKSKHINLCSLSLPNEKISFSQKLIRAYFSLITFGKFWVYYACDENRIVHTSYLLGKCYKFPFMKKGDYEIGPCVTDKEFRGKGIYPSVITRIICDMQNTANTLYMICEENNAPSIKGITKAGFKKESYSLVKTSTKRYLKK